MLKQVFNTVVKKSLDYSARRFSWIYLSFISFIESIFFPIPTDIFLAPMILANRDRTFFLIMITIVFSVLGGLFGYLMGYYFWEYISPKIDYINPSFSDGFLIFKEHFDDMGWMLILIGGFTPLPFKVITISSGIMNLDIYLFTICSLISRSARFFLVCYMFYRFGNGIKNSIERNINQISIFLIVIFLIYITYKLLV